MSKLDDAIVFAAEAHRGQTRFAEDFREPYITHPLRVMSILFRHGVSDEEVLCAAVLHDVVEDTPIDLDQIRSTFGDRVSEMVDVLTKPSAVNKPERHGIVLGRLRGDPEAAEVKMADRLDNLSEIHLTDWAEERRRRYAEQGREFAGIGEKANPDLAVTLRSLCDRLLSPPPDAS